MMRAFVILLFVVAVNSAASSKSGSKQAKKMRCLNPPMTAKKVELFIKECQDEVRTQIVQEALQVLHEKYQEGHYDYNAPDSSSYDSADDYVRHRRNDVLYNPMMVSHEDKRIAGCLLHCVYVKNNAIDKHGWPRLDGLVHFYSDGVNDHAFFMATLRAADGCLKVTSDKYGVNRLELPSRGISCDLAFDIFDCISDQITEYCFDQYSP